MRKVDGYICVAELNIVQDVPRRRLFGPNVGHGIDLYESLITNDFATYSNKKFARKVRTQLRKNQEFNFRSVDLARLVMDIAETLEELTIFENSSDLIIIQINSDFPPTSKKLLGPDLPGRWDLHPIPGAYIIDTDFKTFGPDPEFIRTPYQRAIDLGAEVNRQGGLPFQLATFKLEYV